MFTVVFGAVEYLQKVILLNIDIIREVRLRKMYDISLYYKLKNKYKNKYKDDVILDLYSRILQDEKYLKINKYYLINTLVGTGCIMILFGIFIIIIQHLYK